jgi:hypothetical protein
LIKEQTKEVINVDLIRPLESYIKHCSKDMLQTLRWQLYNIIDIINDKEISLITIERDENEEYR